MTKTMLPLPDRDLARMRGFTLLEMMVVLTILGLLLATFVSAWKIYQAEREKQINETAMSQIGAALSKFYSDNGHYPCPAGPRWAPGSVARGIEDRYPTMVNDSVNVPNHPDVTYDPAQPLDPDDPNIPAVGTYPAGLNPKGGRFLGRCTDPSGAAGGSVNTENAASGIRRTAGYRLNATGDFVSTAASNTIAAQSTTGRATAIATDDTTTFVGDIPFVTLGLPEVYIYDAHGNKITYAISATATHHATIDRSKTNIAVLNFRFDQGAGRVDPTKNENAIYALYGAGKDREGAFSREGGNRFGDCHTFGGIVETNDSFGKYENCDKQDSIYLKSALGISRNLTAAARSFYYDDVVTFINSPRTSIWDVVSSSQSDIRNANTGNIGIGTAPNAAIRLDVAGNARADKIIANNLCTGSALAGTTVTTAGNCFDPTALTGAGITCPAGQILQKIGSTGTTATTGGSGQPLKFTCAAPALSIIGIANQACGAGKWVNGFDAAGNIVCQ